MKTKDQTIKADYRNVPKGYQLCFMETCPKKDECLRFLAGRELPEERDWGPAVYPNMKMTEKGCRLFATGQPTKMAWGFAKLFEEVKSKHEKGLRTAMRQYLNGTSNYYRYNNGERMLNEEQQEWSSSSSALAIRRTWCSNTMPMSMISPLSNEERRTFIIFILH